MGPVTKSRLRADAFFVDTVGDGALIVVATKSLYDFIVGVTVVRAPQK